MSVHNYNVRYYVPLIAVSEAKLRLIQLCKPTWVG